jgi:hypothetical protein
MTYVFIMLSHTRTQAEALAGGLSMSALTGGWYVIIGGVEACQREGAGGQTGLYHLLSTAVA